MTKLNRPISPAVRQQRLAAAICLLLASLACSSGKGTTTADASSDNGPELNIDGKVNSDGKADPADADIDGTDLDGLAYDASGQPDLPGYDVVADCPGGALCPCNVNTDCQSGLCLEDLSVDGGKACAKPCKPSCGPGYVCANLTGGGSDIQQVCVYQSARLCNPCASSKDCEVAGLADSKCVDQGAFGRFCGVVCSADSDCPEGYGCQQVTAVDGGKFKQCVRKADDKQAPYGVCPCSAAAIAKELQTSCATLGGEGAAQCTGVRKCTAQGLSVCLAAASTAETCDGVDNDCDGQTDEATCDDGNPCTADSCKGSKGCVATPTEGGCDDGNPCTVADVCKNGQCQPGNSVCKCQKDSDCPDDGDLCNGQSYCDKGTPPFECKVKAGTVVVCDGSNDLPCSSAVCQPSTGQCSQVSKDDGASCSDGSACTSGDACQAGKCAPGPAVDCNDNNPCTGDSCDPAKGCQFQVLGGEKQSCYSGPAGTAGKGICKQGSKFCDDKGQLSECTGAVSPAAKELCNGLDDSCDGATDEGCAAKDFEIGFAGARLQGGNGTTTVQVAVGRSLVAGGSVAAGQTSVMWGFWKWFKGGMP